MHDILSTVLSFAYPLLIHLCFIHVFYPFFILFPSDYERGSFTNGVLVIFKHIQKQLFLQKQIFFGSV